MYLLYNDSNASQVLIKISLKHQIEQLYTFDPDFIFVKLITCPCFPLFWSYRLLRNVLMSFWGLGSQAISICVGLSSIIELINLRK